MAVEKMHGISRLEQFVEALSEEERAKELKQEKKRQKRKNRRKNKCGFDLCEQEAEDKEKILDEVILPGNGKSRLLYAYLLHRWDVSPDSCCVLQGSIECGSSCKACVGHEEEVDEEEEEAARCDAVTNADTSCQCDNSKQGKII